MFYKRNLLLLIFVIFTFGCQLDSLVSSQSLPIREIIQDCISVKPELPKGFLTNGTALLGDFTEHAGFGSIMALKPESNQPIHLPNIPYF